MDEIFAYVDANKEKFIDNLAKTIEIKSVSAWPEMRPEIVKMVKWMGDELEKCGASIEYCDVGQQTLPDGSKIPLPDVLMGQLGSDPKKKTLLVYGHLDVQPAKKEDGWDYEPFVLTRYGFLNST
jgi:nonspecific dipeptidase